MMSQTIPGWKARMKKREKAARVDPVEQAIFFLLGKGWRPGGKTSEAQVPKGSGKVITFGRRRRFLLPNTPRICTVGKRTTCFYSLDADRNPIDFVNVPTSDMDAVITASGFEHREAEGT